MGETKIGSLEDAFKDVKERLNKAIQDGSELEPWVLDSFNEYVRNVINPQLPEGYDLEEATKVMFEPTKRGFTIVTGKIKIQEKISLDVTYSDCINRIEKLFLEYEKNHPWVKGCVWGFSELHRYLCPSLFNEAIESPSE